MSVQRPVDDICRLCNGQAEALFTLLALGKYEVSYFRCKQCGSVQTERPYWLGESYSDGGLAALDTGAAQRVQNCYALTLLIARLFNVSGPILDFGGGDGLLCRLLRDIGYQAYTIDRFSRPFYAQGFGGQHAGPFELVTAFEVFEHFVEPISGVAEVFTSKPRLVLISTELYAGQTQDWWYFSPETGQHVFFYSSDAIRYISRQMGYSVVVGRGFILFSRRAPTWFQRIALRLIRYSTLRLTRCVIPLLRCPGITHDFAGLKQRIHGALQASNEDVGVGEHGCAAQGAEYSGVRQERRSA